MLKLSKGGAVTGKADVKGAVISQERANALQEEAIAKDNQLRDQKTRVAELEKNIQEMQRLLELKNQNLAELQKQVATKTTCASGSAPVAAPAATHRRQPQSSRQKHRRASPAVNPTPPQEYPLPKLSRRQK